MASFSNDYIRSFILEALEQTKAERDLNGSEEDAKTLVDRVKKYWTMVGKTKRRMIGPDWRINRRKIKNGLYRIYLYSPESNEMPPELYPQKPKEEPRKEEKKYFPDWVLDNLTSQGMKYITVVPREDINRIGSVGASEQILLYLVRQILQREDVRVLITKIGKGRKADYNARLIFLGEEWRKNNEY